MKYGLSFQILVGLFIGSVPFSAWCDSLNDAQVACAKEFGNRFADVKGSRGQLCDKFRIEPKCTSVQGEVIPYYEKSGTGKSPARILVFGQIHGDETDAGVLAAQWIERLEHIPSSSNTWRIVPMLNPDGHHAKTRANANGVDLNRNFPTSDWDEMALSTWSTKLGKNPRRFPGRVAGSEPETQCAIEQIRAFKRDIVVSIHTPYGLLDFDGPKIEFPEFKALPWNLLGQFPGSLGRYLWVDRKVPVLTIELGSNSLKKKGSEFNRLQDLVSLLLNPKASENVANRKAVSEITRPIANSP